MERFILRVISFTNVSVKVATPTGPCVTGAVFWLKLTREHPLPVCLSVSTHHPSALRPLVCFPAPGAESDRPCDQSHRRRQGKELWGGAAPVPARGGVLPARHQVWALHPPPPCSVTPFCSSSRLCGGGGRPGWWAGHTVLEQENLPMSLWPHPFSLYVQCLYWTNLSL